MLGKEDITDNLLEKLFFPHRLCSVKISCQAVVHRPSEKQISCNYFQNYDLRWLLIFSSLVLKNINITDILVKGFFGVF